MAKGMKAARVAKERESRFIALDILIVFVLLVSIFSLFLWDGGKNNADDTSEPREQIAFRVIPDEAYIDYMVSQGDPEMGTELFRVTDRRTIGTLYRGKDGTYYLVCDLSDLRRTVDGSYHIGDTALLLGSEILVRSERADFSLLLISAPVNMTNAELEALLAVPVETTETAESDSESAAESTSETDTVTGK